MSPAGCRRFAKTVNGSIYTVDDLGETSPLERMERVIGYEEND